MYLNDTQRTAFYEGIGLNTKEFDMHVIIEVKYLLNPLFIAMILLRGLAYIILSLTIDRRIERLLESSLLFWMLRTRSSKLSLIEWWHIMSSW